MKSISFGLFLAAFSCHLYLRTFQAAAIEKPAGPANRVEQVLQDLEASSDSPSNRAKRYALTEEELNAYLAQRLREKPDPAIRGISVRLGDGVFTTLATFNPDGMKPAEEDWAGQLFQGLFRGEQNLEITGQLATKAGEGAYQVQEARLSGVSIPPALVISILAPAGKKLDPPFDPTQPFQLPYGIQRIEVETGKVSIFT